ncbi:MAG: purine-nucleoside phosphorylase [Candidatus Omnitrophica bacterium]|nr:purine-nucleoside phosphorylase [Candidatus Omnitrophota bacterium]
MSLVQKRSDLFQKITSAVNAIWRKTAFRPDIAVVLGTGLGNLSKRVSEEAAISYESIPHFPKSTAASHAGRLLFGMLGGKKVVVMDGRFHFYEGYTLEQVTFPIRVLKKLGAQILIVSNAAGGLNLDYKKGDLILIEDHINHMGVNPLAGPNDGRLGIRFPDMSQPYSERLIALAERAGRAKHIPLKRGVYLGVSGPCLETRAEYRMMREWGADLVGMSTVPEVIVGVHAGFEILGISVVTDLCDPGHLKPVNIEEIIRTASEAGPKLDQLIEFFVHQLPHVR